MEPRLVLVNRPHRKTVESAVVAHAGVARIQVEVPRAVRVVHEERTWPIGAFIADTAENVAPTVACSWQEKTITIRRSKKTTVHTILLCTSDGRFVA